MKISLRLARHAWAHPTMFTFLFVLIFSGCKKADKYAPSEDSITDEMLLSGNDHRNKGVDVRVVTAGLASPLGLIGVPDDDQRHGSLHGKGHDNKSGDDTEDKRLFIIDQIGKIWILDANGNRLPEPFLDITDSLIPLNPNGDERGLLGFAFHPDYKQNGRFFVYYNARPRAGGPEPGRTWNNLSRIAEFRVSSDPNKANRTSERPLIELDDPQGNHNGGTIAFGPHDGYLYIAIGDGGGANDVGPGHVQDWYAVNAGGNGQDVEANLFGNILRIDVNSGRPYGIPGDNPFVNKRGLDEIYAYGLRNPYRFSFDMGGSHRLIAGDAGQLLYEEINEIRKGQNYGWNVKEGRHCFNAANSLQELPSCPIIDPFGNRLIDPVIELNNFRNPKGGRATTIIGGNVYRGDDIHHLNGKYIFGTFSQTPGTPNAELFVAHMGGPSWSFQELSLVSSPNDIGYYLKGFGQDNEGEVYLAVSRRAGPTGTDGAILKLVPVKEDKKGGKAK